MSMCIGFRPPSAGFVEEAVIAKVIVRVRDQNAEHDPPPELCAILVGLGAIPPQSIGELILRTSGSPAFARELERRLGVGTKNRAPLGHPDSVFRGAESMAVLENALQGRVAALWKRPR